MIPFSLLVKVVVCPVAGAAFTGSTRRCAPPRTMPAAYQMSGGRRTGATANPVIPWRLTPQRRSGAAGQLRTGGSGPYALPNFRTRRAAPIRQGDCEHLDRKSVV